MKISAFKKERNIVIKIHDNAKGIIISPIEKFLNPISAVSMPIWEQV